MVTSQKCNQQISSHACIFLIWNIFFKAKVRKAACSKCGWKENLCFLYFSKIYASLSSPLLFHLLAMPSLHSAPLAGTRHPQPVSPATLHDKTALLELIAVCTHLLVDSRKEKVRSHPPLRPCHMQGVSVQWRKSSFQLVRKLITKW